MGTFNTLANIGYFVEIPDPADSNQRIRPPAGTVIKVKTYPAGVALPDSATLAGGYISITTDAGVDAIQVSADSWATSPGPWYSTEWFSALTSIPAQMADTLLVDARQDASLAALAGGSGSGGGTVHAQTWNTATGSLEPSDDFTIIVAPNSAAPAVPTKDLSQVWLRNG